MSNGSEEYRAYLASEHWQGKRKEALIRAGFKCQICASPDGLDVHHNSYANRGNERPEDLVVLCRTHHDMFHDSMPSKKSFMAPVQARAIEATKPIELTEAESVFAALLMFDRDLRSDPVARLASEIRSTCVRILLAEDEPEKHWESLPDEIRESIQKHFGELEKIPKGDGMRAGLLREVSYELRRDRVQERIESVLSDLRRADANEDEEETKRLMSDVRYLCRLKRTLQSRIGEE